jgi:hypothetical protein
MNKQILSITEYVSWLLKEYQKIKNSHSEMAIYKLIEVKENKNDGVVLVVQLNGTATIFQTTPEEVLADDALTEKFSSKDIRSITYHACQHMAKPKSRIALKRFCQKLNKIVFGIKHFNKEQIEEKTAKDISLDKNLINNLSSEDAHLIGFMTANEDQININQEKALLQKNKKDRTEKKD